jgi:hypothetical protein
MQRFVLLYENTYYCNSKDCSVSHIRISVPAFLLCIHRFSPVSSSHGMNENPSVQFSEEFSESQAASGTIETISVEMAFCKDFQNP